jgi:hypothetical protein
MVDNRFQRIRHFDIDIIEVNLSGSSSYGSVEPPSPTIER